MNTSHSKRDDQNRRDTILVIILVFVCIGLFGIGSLISREIKGYSIVSSLGMGNSQDAAQSAPTLTPTPKPTNTPTSTPKKTAAVKPPSKETASQMGLGVSLKDIQSAYAKEGFVFTDTQTANDTVHSLGKTSNGLAAIELSGDTKNIRDAAVICYLAKDKPEQLKDSLDFMAQMIKLVLPNWKDGTKWLLAKVGQLAASKTRPMEIETIYQDISIRLKMMDTPSLIVLSLVQIPQN